MLHHLFNKTIMKKSFAIIMLFVSFSVLVHAQQENTDKKGGKSKKSNSKTLVNGDTIKKVSVGARVVEYVMSHSKLLGGIVYAVMH